MWYGDKAVGLGLPVKKNLHTVISSTLTQEVYGQAQSPNKKQIRYSMPNAKT